MSYYINMFFSTELTCIPRIVDAIIGKYYSNAVGNALTWVFAMWLIVHYIFDSYLNILFKQMNYKEFTRIRLLNSLWYCGFYGTAFLYCLGSVLQNNSEITNYTKNLALDGGQIPLHILMGLGLMGTFFFQSLIWNICKSCCDRSSYTYLALTILPIMTYYTRRTELFLSLLALITLLHFMFNALRCLSSITKKENLYLNGLFFGILSIFILVHVIIIPIFFIVPLIYNMKYGLNISLILLLINLVLWWISEALSNPLYKFMEHWIKQSCINNPRICPDNMLECCLFPIRDDFSFNMSMEMREIKQRKNTSIQQRKPKDRGVLVQTLKCMVAIRRKLKKRRSSESSEGSEDSDSDSGKITPTDEDGNEADSSEEESSASEDDDPAAQMKREYREETARALLEDQMLPQFADTGDGDVLTTSSNLTYLSSDDESETETESNKKDLLENKKND